MRTLAIATLAATAAALCAAPAFAQSVEELTVTGQSSNQQASKSRAVSFADLDLTRKADRQMLRTRVINTAGSICEELNEAGPAPGAPGKTCRDIAARNALADVKVAVANARGAAYADAAFADGWAAPAADSYGAQASADATMSATSVVTTVTNGPVADTPENRARYGGPVSKAGKRSGARGN